MTNPMLTVRESDDNSINSSYNRSESRNIKILVVDDEIDILDEMKECLDSEGFDCQQASNAMEALSMVRHDPDILVIITDIKMVGLDGMEMMHILHDEYQDNREFIIIVSSAYMNVDMMIEALHVGANDFLIKPLSLDVLLRTVKKSIASFELVEVERKSHEKIESHDAQYTRKSQQLSKELLTVNNELKSKNMLIAAANQIKSDFVCLISHEMRTPLNTIIGLSTLAMHSVSTHDGVDFNMKIADAGKKVLCIINSILELVNVDTRNFVLNKNVMSIEGIINNVVDVLESKATDNSIKMVVKVESFIPMFSVDAKRLSLAFNNVIMNAIQFSSEGSEVIILIKMEGEDCLVSVKDEGIGMSNNEVQIALQRFRQVDASDCKKAYGIGLGLTLARMYIELHAGSLSIMSKPNLGTTVSMVIPMSLI